MAEQCVCTRSPEDYEGPAQDCPEHGDPAILGYDPNERRELEGACIRLSEENDELRAERDEAWEQCSDMERQHRFAQDEARGRAESARTEIARLTAENDELRAEIGETVDGMSTGMYADVAEAHSAWEDVCAERDRFRLAWLSARKRAADDFNNGAEALAAERARSESLLSEVRWLSGT